MAPVLSFARRHIIGVVALFIALGGTSYAAIDTVAQKSNKTYYACVTQAHNTLNLSTKAAKCPAGQRKISFNAKGADGVKGAKGDQGAAGLRGETGPTGPKGADGERGPTGPSVLGSPGALGAKGDKGDTGETGAVGAKGDTGAMGAVGAKGDTGATGLPGLAGATGPQGAKGDTGNTGATGLPGLAGATGPQGAKGDTGNTGAAGPAGAKGDTGDRGATGAAGPAGATGDRGPAGATGANGAAGPAGPQGPAGPAGPAGGGIRLIDGNNVTLGTVVSSTRAGATVVTSSAYQVTVNFDGTFTPAQIYYTGANCTGTAYLNDGNGGTGPFDRIFGRQVVFSRAMNTLMVPATVTNGTALGVAFTSATIDNPLCGASAGTVSGWQLTAITRAAAGLPATIATPLRLG